MIISVTGPILVQERCIEVMTVRRTVDRTRRSLEPETKFSARILANLLPARILVRRHASPPCTRLWTPRYAGRLWTAVMRDARLLSLTGRTQFTKRPKSFTFPFFIVWSIAVRSCGLNLKVAHTYSDTSVTTIFKSSLRYAGREASGESATAIFGFRIC
jgi:hypothetical protein